MYHEITSVKRTLKLTDAPEVTGTTSGLNTRTIIPDTVQFWTHRNGTVATLQGWGVSDKTGKVTKAYLTVKVALDHDDRYHRYAEAPQWVRDLWVDTRGQDR